MSDYSAVANNWVGACVLYLSLFLLLHYRDNIALTILFLFIGYANYSIVVGVYWFPEIRSEGLYSQINQTSVFGDGIISLLLFEIVLYLGAVFGKKKLENKQLYIEARPNVYIEMVCMAAFLLIFVTQFQFNGDERASTSPLSEYRYIPFLFGSAYSTKNNKSRLLWTILIGATSLLTFFGGNRVNTMPTLVLLVLLWYPRIKPTHIICAAPFAVVLLQMVGDMRTDFAFTLDGISMTMSAAWEDKFVADTFTFAYMPALSSLELAKYDGFLQKLNLLVDNVLYIFLGGEYGSSMLCHYTRKFFVHYSGFIAPLNFNYWFKLLGPVILGLIVHLHVKMIKAVNWTDVSNRGLQFFLAAVIVGISSRWYVYNVLQVLRTDFIIFVAWNVVGFFSRFIAPKRQRILGTTKWND